MQEKPIQKIVLAYSGGLDTSVILRWLIENYSAEVVAYVADVGQEEELEGLEEKAKKTGASTVYIEDLRKEFVEEYIFRAIRAHARYEGLYLLGTSLARPLIAKRQVEIAQKENADALAHGATGKGNDQVRFELAFQSLAPDLSIIAPWREWDLHSRSELIDFARRHGIDVPVSTEKPYSSDRNLMHISFEGGILEDPTREPNEDMFVLTESPMKAPDRPEYLRIHFERGNPVALNGEVLDSLPLFQSLNRIAGRHGVGRVDIVENRLVGIKSRGVYESPGATILMIAHADLESLTLERDTAHYKEMLSLKYAELLYNGFWFHPLRYALDCFMDSTQKWVNGEVEVKLYKGTCSVSGRTSTDSLYNQDLATFERDEVYRQKDAEGFIRLLGLSSKESAKRDKRQKRRKET